MNNSDSRIFFIMGVSGVGKTTVGKLLAQNLNIPFFDGDDFHPEHNIKKMASGQSLNDDDRQEWLKSLNKLAKEQSQESGCVIACSALKEKYRTLLENGLNKPPHWVYLEGSFDLISSRLKNRKGHYMPSNLLQSQFDTLEIPDNALTFNVDNPPEEIVEMIDQKLNDQAEFGLIGLGVMGKSLCRNLASKGVKISMFNRHVPGKEENIASDFKKQHKELESALAFDELNKFVSSLQQPRKIFLMVNAGPAIDAVIEKLTPLLSKNDIIIDGGNSHYEDTARRTSLLSEKGLFFIGCGVSGGEEGALKGPSIMPGGDLQAYDLIKPYLEKIAARDKNAKPCCTYIGKSGSGHFTKMLHNGIEYAEMQLLAEIYQIFKAKGNNPDEIAEILSKSEQDTKSYLLEITVDILKKKEGDDWLIHKILDKAGNKGTGNWTTIASAQLGVPSTLIAGSLFARYLSAFKDDRVRVQKILPTELNGIDVTDDYILEAYQLARIINHIQGFKFLKEASETYKWSLNLSEIARIWTNGCIIRSELMEKLVELLKNGDDLILHTEISSSIKKLKPALTKVVAKCIESNIAVPCLSEAINYLNGISQADSPANLIQAQRDYFGAHTYQRVDDKSGKFHHTEWLK
ncbi:MAG: decarboxylating NADP(+)-dependent phosphogluconate dehydrogenase [Bacteroidota bacterium]